MMLTKLESIIRKTPSFTHVSHSIDLEDELTRVGLERTSAGDIRWQNDNAHHPRNWTVTRKTFDTLVIFFLEFFTYVLVESHENLTAAHY
jgi:hypothetical protein